MKGQKIEELATTYRDMIMNDVNLDTFLLREKKLKYVRRVATRIIKLINNELRGVQEQELPKLE